LNWHQDNDPASAQIFSQFKNRKNKKAYLSNQPKRWSEFEIFECKEFQSRKFVDFLSTHATQLKCIELLEILYLSLS
jgi:hypothetical protein